MVLGHVPQLPEGQRPLVAPVKAAEQGLELLGRKPAVLRVSGQQRGAWFGGLCGSVVLLSRSG